jgi:hypothetical protein
VSNGISEQAQCCGSDALEAMGQLWTGSTADALCELALIYASEFHDPAKNRLEVMDRWDSFLALYDIKPEVQAELQYKISLLTSKGSIAEGIKVLEEKGVFPKGSAGVYHLAHNDELLGRSNMCQTDLTTPATLEDTLLGLADHVLAQWRMKAVSRQLLDLLELNG